MRSVGVYPSVRAFSMSTGTKESEVKAALARGYSRWPRNQYTRGQSIKDHPHYNRYAGIVSRCYDRKCRGYKDYGGRGIDMLIDWRLYPEKCLAYLTELPGFIAGYSSIDRIDNDKGYYPGNLKWSTRLEQRTNQREVSNKWGIPGLCQTNTGSWVVRKKGFRSKCFKSTDFDVAAEHANSLNPEK